jgi:hypothetical protein
MSDVQSQVSEMANERLNGAQRLGVRKEIKTLSSHLGEGEQVLNLSNGMYSGNSGLVVLTDRRVIFYSAGMGRSRFEDFP